MNFFLEHFTWTGKIPVWFLRISVPTQLKGKGFQSGHSGNSSCSSLKPGKTRQRKSAQISQEQCVQRKTKRVNHVGPNIQILASLLPLCDRMPVFSLIQYNAGYFNSVQSLYHSLTMEFSFLCFKIALHTATGGLVCSPQSLDDFMVGEVEGNTSGKIGKSVLMESGGSAEVSWETDEGIKGFGDGL